MFFFKISSHLCCCFVFLLLCNAVRKRKEKLILRCYKSSAKYLMLIELLGSIMFCCTAYFYIAIKYYTVYYTCILKKDLILYSVIQISKSYSLVIHLIVQVFDVNPTDRFCGLKKDLDGHLNVTKFVNHNVRLDATVLIRLIEPWRPNLGHVISVVDFGPKR